jgi:ABC-type uncharacterized transport system ATPase subunit
VDAIVAEELVKRYKDVQALDGLSFSVRDGEVFGLLGPNARRNDPRTANPVFSLTLRT